MYGEEATKLIRETKRNQHAEYLLPYDHDRVRSVCRENRSLYEEAHQIIGKLKVIQKQLQTQDEHDPQVNLAHYNGQLCSIMIHKLAINRNKRCLMAYHHHRVNRLRELAWKLGRLPTMDTNTTVTSRVEDEFFARYMELVHRYKTRYAEVDLTASLLPPKNLFIEVRALRDCGEIQTENGVLNVTRGSQFFARRTDVERLITQGYLKHIA
ncbi:uncharacterized protein VTP21DRAFT_4556 [Calcarisporiella thermophila]|uniref:uncharacterized protein n=1 Tax=Calcarisporiella thermophila TaxID=911321 RepID=UPI0037438045